MAIPPANSQPGSLRYASREPILTATQKVIGYKLFFRSASCVAHSGDAMEGRMDPMLHLSSLVGLNTLCDGRLAFLTCSLQSLVERHLTLLPSERVVAELPSSIPPSGDVLTACHELRQAGYRIAIDCPSMNDLDDPLLEFADFLKVDLHKVPAADIEAIAHLLRRRGTRLLADRVETWEDFRLAQSAGFQYFQGHFFRKPEVLHTRHIDSLRTVGLELLQIILEPQLDWKEIEDILKRDATLYYRLLRYLNSATFALQNEVRSIRQALTILGEDEFRRWCRLAILLDTAQNRPSDLVLSALIRARFAELIGQKLRILHTDLFLLGLLSLMDAILEIPMSAVIDGLSLSPDIRTALLDHKGPLTDIYDLTLAVEAGSWGSTVRICESLHLEEEFVADVSFQAIEWAQLILPPD